VLLREDVQVGKNSGDRSLDKDAQEERASQRSVSRRSFLSKGAAGVGATAFAGVGANEAEAEVRWDLSADVVVIGAGVAGLPAAITARDLGASVIVVDENFDIGGRGMLSGGRVHLGGGHALQQKAGIKDTADQVFADWVRHDAAVAKYSDRDLVRVFADENVATFDFLVENGAEFRDRPIGPEAASTVPRTFVTLEWHVPSEVYAPGGGRDGSGLVRRLEESARKKGVQILLRHEMKSIIREPGSSGKVVGIAVTHPNGTLNIEARRGLVVATGGHTGNVNFRRTFDPRLTEEYQQACMPCVYQGAKGELVAMDVGAALWATANQTNESGSAITKTRHIGCRWGYSSLVFRPESKLFPLAKATGLTVRDWQDMIFVNQTSAPIADAQVRVGAHRAATDPLGLAEVDMPKGVYELDIWKVGYEAPTRTVRLDNNMLVEVQAVPVPEEDPDAAWLMWAYETLIERAWIAPPIARTSATTRTAPWQRRLCPTMPSSIFRCALCGGAFGGV
jgi:hypothetical protein